MQLIRFTRTTGNGNLWINPDQIIYAEVIEMKEEKGKATILHLTGKEGKVFVKESPEEINKILRNLKKELKIEFQGL